MRCLHNHLAVTHPFLLIATLIAVGWPLPALAQTEQHRVLVLYSTGRDAAISVTGERDLPRVLDRGLARQLDYHAEYLDAGRFAQPRYQAGFRDFLRLKYGGQQFAIVIAVLDVAVEFVATYRNELFPDTPVVFLARNPPTSQLGNATGVLVRVDHGSTLSLALALQPEIREVFVVSGASSRDKVLEDEVRADFRQFEPRLTFTYLSGLPTADLVRRLATLPNRAVVYYVLVYQDGNGQLFQPIDYLDRIAPFSNRPIYSWVDSVLGHGAIGGNVLHLESQVNAIAALALRVIAGENADSIPVAELSLKANLVDARELRRWGISESRLPAGTVVRFRDSSLWDRYKLYIAIAGLLLTAQTGLIAGLLIQASRRRKAEAEVHRSHAELRKSSEHIRDLGRRLLAAQEDERSRISRELHDDIMQQMALLEMDLQLLTSFDEQKEDDGDKLVRQAYERAHIISRSVHDLSYRLHPAKLRLIGLVRALEGLQREYSRADLSIVFSHENVPGALSDELMLCLFRVVQEALQNAAKHSGARQVSLRLQGGDNQLRLTVVDDGKGFEVDRAWGRGLGLVSMSERLEAIGGTLSIRSAPGAGTRLEIVAPLASSSLRKSVTV